MMTEPQYPTTNQVVGWLAWRWPDATVLTTQQGRLGRVWIMENPGRVSPRRFALKGFQPEAFDAAPEGDIRALFARELSLWLELPPHPNVLPALGLELVPVNGMCRDGRANEATYPLMRMPYRDTSLEAWVDDAKRPALGEVLAGLAQLANGLRWLYDRGIEGHGDLKPDNVLAHDLREMFSAHAGKDLPLWKIEVADLGWADIWRELEGPRGTQKAQRIYLAPERLDGEVIPIRSDIFSFGVIAAEVLTGIHPSGKSRKAIGKSAGSYGQWAAGGQRQIDAPRPEVPVDLLRACLDPDPMVRPMPAEIIDELARCANGLLAFELGALLSAWAKHAASSDQVKRRRWSTEEIAKLGGKQLDEAVALLRSKYQVTSLPTNPPACAEWTTAAISLGRCLLRRDKPEDREEARTVALSLLQFVLDHDTLDLRDELWRLPSGQLVVSDLKQTEVLVGIGRTALSILEGIGCGADSDVISLQTRLARIVHTV